MDGDPICDQQPAQRRRVDAERAWLDWEIVTEATGVPSGGHIRRASVADQIKAGTARRISNRDTCFQNSC